MYHPLSRYALEFVYSMMEKMIKFASRLYRDLILENKASLLKKDMDISRLVMYIKQVEYEKGKLAKIRKSQGNKFHYPEQGGG